ncbi:alpha-mannosidase [Marinitoga sp. 1135]|uniref:alpha-mannosidase n=1 Tax=unclassified Marinitoga TaxID=2640159 RepID=UPI000950B1A5|nr:MULTISPECIES: glycoside hydrolase family 38 C-terminal domain-containing protein [unclassified Marinitoga]APT76003.1 alpha-mannosidase [Marinitoga sp. 1137]NUU95746.1 alpha-mannosidase [Marinitoga sp. 1135]
MYRDKDKEISHLKRLLSEFYPYCIIERKEYIGWKNNDIEITIPYTWKGNIASFENFFSISEKNFYLRVWCGGESLVLIDNKPHGEINPYHREIDLTPFADGKKHKIKIETVPRGLFGTKETSEFNESFLIKYDINFKKALLYVFNIIQIAEETDDFYLAKKLIDLTDNFLSSIYVPRDTQLYLKSLYDNKAIIDEIKNIWEPPEIIPFTGTKDNTNLKNEFLDKFKKFKDSIKSLYFPKNGKVNLIGHAHIDYAWLWPIEETKRKILRTFSNAVTLAKKYPEFIYTQSSAVMYKDIKEMNSSLYNEIKKLIKKDKWEPIGGMWVESDCMIPSVESLIRQFYYGQKFFELEFGKKSSVCWLPDVFGFSWTLPQILKEAGIDYFITTKLNWNESNNFPYDLCKWRGIDGSEVIYYNFKNMEEGYNGKISAKSIINTWKNFREKDKNNTILLSFGYGDGGGGPTEEMCENYYALNDVPGIPEIAYSKIEEFVKNLNIENLETWDDELYLELHRGTLTSQSRTKILHKKSEDKLRETEIFNALTNNDFQKEIDNLWKIHLYNEFHDILPGSAINEVYKKSENDFSYILETLETIKNNIFKNTSSENDIYIFNPSSFSQYILFEDDNLYKIKNKDYIVQKTFDGKYLYYINEKIDPLSSIKLSVEKNQKIESYKTFFETTLRIDIFDDGTINIYNKSNEKYLFNEKGNILYMYKDIPYYWENWDIDPNYHKSAIKLNAEKIENIEDGPIRKVIKVLYRIENTEIIQYYIHWKHINFIEIKNKIHWHHRRTLLKAIFQTNILSRYLTCDIDNGYITRPTHKNTKFEKARFEFMAQRWINISQIDNGVSIINNGKYGYSAKNNEIGISLIKSGTYPDFYADEGIHEFSYGIYPSNDIKSTIILSENFNKPLKKIKGSLSYNNFIKIKNSNFKIYALKKIDINTFVLRLAEVMGSSGKTELYFPHNIKKVYLANILEEKKKELKIKNGVLPLIYKPFKIYTLILTT